MGNILAQLIPIKHNFNPLNTLRTLENAQKCNQTGFSCQV